MRVSLINLGDGDRCLYDIRNRIVSVPTGEIVSAELSEQTLKNLIKFQKTDTLLVGPEGAFSPPVKLRVALGLLKIIDDEHYEAILRQFLELQPPKSSTDIRPSRGQMRLMLRGIIESHLRKVRKSEDDATLTHDDIGADELARENAEMEKRRADAAKVALSHKDAAVASRSHEPRRQQGGRRR